MLWVLGSVGFSLYVNNFGSYNKTYGALAGVVVLMLWLYLTSYIVLLGAEINAESERQTAGTPPWANRSRWGSGTPSPPTPSPSPPTHAARLIGATGTRPSPTSGRVRQERGDDSPWRGGMPMARIATSSSRPSPKLASSSMSACTTSGARAGARRPTNCCRMPSS